MIRKNKKEKKKKEKSRFNVIFFVGLRRNITNRSLKNVAFYILFADDRSTGRRHFARKIYSTAVSSVETPSRVSFHR